MIKIVKAPDMFGINKNKMKLSGLGLGGLEIEELFENLNSEEQTFITNKIQYYIGNGYDIRLAITSAKIDLTLRKYLTQ